MKLFFFIIPMPLLLFLASCRQPVKVDVDVLLLHAGIVAVSDGKTIPDQFVAIRKDTIVAVGSMGDHRRFSSAKTLDIKGKFVMPGLWDNHVHFRGGYSLIQENKNMLPLFLAHGITTVRDAGGDITPSVLQWRRAINKEPFYGPTIFTSGPKLDGTKPAWAGSLQVENETEISAALDSLQAMNVDYVKMYDGNLSAEAFYGIIQAAEKRGLKTTGHMPLSADILKAASYGLDGSEHLYYVLKACSPAADSLTSLGLGYGMVANLIHTYDTKLAATVFDTLAKRRVFVTPTLYIGKVLAEVLDTDHSQDSLLSYMGKGIQKTYEGRVEGAKKARSAGNSTRSQAEKKFKEMVKPMYEAGIPLLAGSDCGPYNSYVYPGASLLSELEALVQAGLTPQEALTTSVINGPKFFGLEKQYGQIEPGKMADILILDKNPLENIAHLNTLSILVVKGKILDKAKIWELLKEIKQN